MRRFHNTSTQHSTSAFASRLASLAGSDRRVVLVAMVVSVTVLGCEPSARPMPTVERFECARCHTIPGVEPPHPNLDCTGCHQSIYTDVWTGRVDADELKQWRQNIRHLRITPSLHGVRRLQKAWFVEFVQNPHSLRPGLPEHMPRLPITEADADKLAAELGIIDRRPTKIEGDPRRGRQIYEEQGCATCHHFSGADAPPGPALDGVLAPAVRRAPDLRHARKRLSAADIDRWIENPKALKSDTMMDVTISDPEKRRDVVAFLTQAWLDRPPMSAGIQLPDPVDRPVRWDEVNEKIFHATCRHCHTEGGPALPGEGGAGNTGGFGYDGAGLILSTYEGVKAGSTRRGTDVLARDAEGVAPLVRHLMARHDEHAGYHGEMIGMPLGLPAVAVEDIAILRAWIGQGAPR